jgi:hypothetical protein
MVTARRCGQGTGEGDARGLKGGELLCIPGDSKWTSAVPREDPVRSRSSRTCSGVSSRQSTATGGQRRGARVRGNM